MLKIDDKKTDIVRVGNDNIKKVFKGDDKVFGKDFKYAITLITNSDKCYMALNGGNADCMFDSIWVDDYCNLTVYQFDCVPNQKTTIVLDDIIEDDITSTDFMFYYDAKMSLPNGEAIYDLAAGIIPSIAPITYVDFSSFDTSKVNSMSFMFNFKDIMTDDSLFPLEICNLDTSNVTNMSNMFRGLQLESLDFTKISKWNTTNVTNMGDMFRNCTALTELNIMNFDTSNVKYMDGMFYDCTSLESLDFTKIPKWNTANVTNMNKMFHNCSNLTELNLSNFDTSNVTSTEYMFIDCSKLKSLDLSNFDTSNVKNIHSMFYGCSSLESLDLSNFDTSKVTTYHNMFDVCYKLKHIKCKQSFKDWCMAHLKGNSMENGVALPFAMREGGDGVWEIVD